MATRNVRVRKPVWDEHSGCMVRLRDPKIPISGTVSSHKYGDERWTLYPGVWAKLPERIYEAIRGKFEHDYETEVPDVKYHEQYPHDPEEKPRMKTEVHSPFIMEFRKERQTPPEEKVKVSQSAFSKKDRKFMEGKT